MQTAAVALDLGWRDSIGLLALSPGDAQIARAIVTVAGKIRVERDQQFADYLAARTAQQSTEGLAAVVRSALKSFR